MVTDVMCFGKVKIANEMTEKVCYLFTEHLKTRG